MSERVQSLRREMQRAADDMRGKTGYLYEDARSRWYAARNAWRDAVKAAVQAANKDAK